jgi:hypothetical protein
MTPVPQALEVYEQVKRQAVMQTVLELFAGEVETPYTIAFWLISPQELLGGMTPAEWLASGRGPELLHEAARRAVARLSH